MQWRAILSLESNLIVGNKSAHSPPRRAIMSDNTFSSHTPGAVFAASAAGGAARVLPSAATDPTSIRPFHFTASPGALDDLPRRANATNCPELAPVTDPAHGVHLATYHTPPDDW